MRRSPIAKRTTLLFLILSGLFNLFSYSLDQMVVQQEDNIRAITREMNLQKTELDTLRQSLNTLEDLTFSTGRYSNEFLYSIASTQRFVEFFNIHSKSIKEIEDRFRKIYTEESIAKINKEYQKNFHKNHTQRGPFASLRIRCMSFPTTKVGHRHRGDISLNSHLKYVNVIQ